MAPSPRRSLSPWAQDEPQDGEYDDRRNRDQQWVFFDDVVAATAHGMGSTRRSAHSTPRTRDASVWCRADLHRAESRDSGGRAAPTNLSRAHLGDCP
jgi:hypothetical protein